MGWNDLSFFLIESSTVTATLANSWAIIVISKMKQRLLQYFCNFSTIALIWNFKRDFERI